MRITFLTPCYMWGPSGGYRVIYQYANLLVARGHSVSVVHPRILNCAAPSDRLTLPEKLTKAAHLRKQLRKIRTRMIELVRRPTVNWHPIDPRVRMLYVPTSEERFIPDADVIFATAWNTVESVLACAPSKGEKCYLIQHHETFLGPEPLVNATWRLPLSKVVVSKWLLQLGKELGASNITYVPNGINHTHYSLKQPIAGRQPRVAMMFSSVPFKRSRDGIEALQIARQRYPNLTAVLFGKERRKSWIPSWMEYRRDPDQQFLVSEIYNKSSIFLSPSLAEGFGLPPAEAAACGCALVCTDSGGVRDYAEHGITALLSAPQDPVTLAEHIHMLFQDGPLRVRLAEAAHERVKRFTWDRSADLMERFIRGVADGRDSRQPEIAVNPIKTLPSASTQIYES